MGSSGFCQVLVSLRWLRAPFSIPPPQPHPGARTPLCPHVLTGSPRGAGHGWAQSSAASRGLAAPSCPWGSWQGERGSRLGWHRGPSTHPMMPVKALYHFPKFSTTVLHLYWGAELGFFWGEMTTTALRMMSAIIPAPLLAVGKREGDGCTRPPHDSPSPPCFASHRARLPPWWMHSQRQPVLHGIEAVEALPVDEPVHGVVADLQERLQGAGGGGRQPGREGWLCHPGQGAEERGATGGHSRAEWVLHGHVLVVS